MFDVAPTELLVVAIIALLVIGPKDLPKAMRFVGQWVAKARSVARQFRSGFDTMVREAELAEMEKKWADENARIMRDHPQDGASAVTPAAASAPSDDAAPAVLAHHPHCMTIPRRRSIWKSTSRDCAANEIDQSQAPLLDHLIELRRRLLFSAVAILLAFGICYAFAEEIFSFLVQPLLKAGQDRVIFTQIFEAFFVQIKVAFFAAMMVSFPVIANQLWQFVAPGLYRNERRALLPFLLATPILFTMGASLAYYVTIPVALNFLLGFQGNFGGIQQQALPSVGNYLSFVMQFLFAFGIAFLLPVLLMLLERAGIVTRAGLKGFRRYSIVAAFAVSAVMTPPDIGSQFLLAVPLVLLYEIAIIGIWFTERKRAKVADAEKAA